MEKEYRHNNKVAIYRSADGETQLSVEIDKDTVWLSMAQGLAGCPTYLS